MQYSAELLAGLSADFVGVCSPMERLAVVGDLWATVVNATADLGEWLRLVDRLDGEVDPDVWAAVSGPLTILGHVVTDEDRAAFESYVRRVAGRAFSRLGWEPVEGEDQRLGIARGRLITLLARVGADEAVRAEAAARLERFATDPAAISPDVLTATVAAVAAAGGDAAYDAILARFRSAATPQDRTRYLVALGGFSEPAHLMASLRLALSDEVRSQDGPMLIANVLANRTVDTAVWSWLEANQGRLAERFPRSLLLRAFDGLTVMVDEDMAAAAHRFFEATELPIKGTQLRQLEERIEVNVAFGARVRPVLAERLRSS